MELVNLALSHPALTHSPHGGVPDWFPALAYFSGLFALVYLSGRARRTAKFRGPALTGTAQVLSAARGGGLAGLFAGGYSGNVMCKIALRVEIPGRPPYDVTVKTLVGSRTLGALCVDGQRWEPGQPWHVRPGTTVAVEVDSANPENVRIDFGEPMTQLPGSPYSRPPQRRSWFDLSGMSPGYRVLLIGWWVVCAGVILTVLTVLITQR